MEEVLGSSPRWLQLIVSYPFSESGTSCHMPVKKHSAFPHNDHIQHAHCVSNSRIIDAMSLITAIK